MRSIVWVASGAAIGAALAGLVALGGTDRAYAQGMMMGQAPPPKVIPHRTVKPRAKKRRYYYGPAYKSCGLYKYWSKGKCLDARTTPPKLK